MIELVEIARVLRCGTRMVTVAGRRHLFQGQLTIPPCRLQGPRGPAHSGPTWFRRRPELSQQPAGSQCVTWTGRSVDEGDAGGGASVTGRGGVPATWGAGTAWTGWGAPERFRSGPGRNVPRHASEARTRARASWRAFSAVPSEPFSAASSSPRAWWHWMESMGSPANAGVGNTAKVSSKKRRGLSMAGGAGVAALSDTLGTGRCLRCKETLTLRTPP